MSELFPEPMLASAREILDLCRARRLKITTAESCTGGLVAGLLTEIAGSSDVVERGHVVYSNEAKREVLGVSAQTLETYGAVSRETAIEMAQGALLSSQADIAISVTGVAGPGGGSPAKPVGLVHFACAGPGDRLTAVEKHFGDLGRGEVRQAAVVQAIAMIAEAATS